MTRLSTPVGKLAFQPLSARIAPTHYIDPREISWPRNSAYRSFPAAMIPVRVTGIVYRQIAGQSPTTRLALAYRRGETSPVVRNFVARAVS